MSLGILPPTSLASAYTRAPAVSIRPHAQAPPQGRRPERFTGNDPSPAAIVTLSPQARRLAIAAPQEPSETLALSSAAIPGAAIPGAAVPGTTDPEVAVRASDGSAPSHEAFEATNDERPAVRASDGSAPSHEGLEATDDDGRVEPNQPAGETSPTREAGSAALSESDKKDLDGLQQRDKEVRAHEQSHVAVGGSLASSASYTFQVGPDGERYAVAGEVPIQVSPAEGSPEATVLKMEQIQRAALAPAEPSGTDRQIAARAAALEAEARTQLAQQSGEGADSTPSPPGEVEAPLGAESGTEDRLEAGSRVSLRA